MSVRDRLPAARSKGARRYTRLLLCAALSLLSGCSSVDSAGRKAEFVRRGDELLAKRQYAEASAAYRLAVKADPQDGHVRLKLAKTAVLAGNWDEASAEAVRAGDLLPNDIDAQLLAATQMLSQGRFLDVAERMSVILQHSPNNVPALLLWANAKARLLNGTWALYSLADTIVNRDAFERALYNLRRQPFAIDDDAAAERGFRQTLALAPAVADARLALANFLWATDRADEAEPLLRGLADEMPQHALVNHAIGSFYLSRKRGPDAVPYLARASAAGEEGRSARFALADYYSEANLDEKAISFLQSMTRQDDSSGAVTVRLAKLAHKASRNDEAIRTLDLLLARHQEHPQALLIKAQVLLTQKRVTEALKTARLAVHADTSSSEARSTLGHALAAAGDLKGACDEYLEAVRLKPGAFGPRLELASVSLALGRNEQAVQFGRDAVRQLPGDMNAVGVLVRAMIATGDHASAEKVLEPLKLQGPAAHDLLMDLAAWYRARGKYDAARASLTRALRAQPGSERASSALLALEREVRNKGAGRNRGSDGG